MNTFWSICLIIIAGYVLSSPNAWWRNENQHTHYSVNCSNLEEDIHSCTGIKYPVKATYLAIPETQTIISKELFIKYDDCTVFNAANWECNTLTNDDYNPDLVMRDGGLMQVPYDRRAFSRPSTRIEYILRDTASLISGIL